MKYKVTLNGKTYEIEVNDQEAVLLEEYQAATAFAGPAESTPAKSAAPAPAKSPVPQQPVVSAAPAAGAEVVSAPMPGTVLRICVSSGQTVKSGDVLLILEAMKMENEIVAPCDGIVDQIITGHGMAVDAGARLLTIQKEGGISGTISTSLARVPAAPAKKMAPAPLRTAPTTAPAAVPDSGSMPDKGETVEAPMPGTIISVKVTEGQNVKSGQVLLILEAMKMENEIVSPRDGVIAQVVTSQGAAVDSGAPLIVLQ